MKNFTERQKLILVGLITGTIIALLIGFTFAYWTWESTSAQRTAVSFTIGNGFSCSADGGGNITSNDVQLMPTDCTDTAHAIKRTVKVSTTQSSGKTIYLDMGLKVNDIGTGLANSSNFKYALTTSATGCNSGIVASGTFQGTTTNSEVGLFNMKKYQTATNNDTYYLWVWLDKAETSTSTQNQTFNISLTGSCTDEEPAPITSSWGQEVDRFTTVNFSQTSVTNGTNGLYLFQPTAADTHPVYYYRGNVANNNVLFAGFCWKIVRTTSTGGTKLIYNGTPVDGQCTNTTGTETQLAETKAFNSSYNSPAYVGYMYGTKYTYSSKSSSNLATSYKYGNGITWNGSSYTLTNTIDSTGTWATDYNTLNNNHYTCFNDTGTCASVYYIYYTNTSNAYYITLTNGKTVENAIDEMLTSSSNTTDSTIKAYLDSWYTANLTSYANYLEDTVWCNDRSISALNGWNPDGGDTTKYLYFGAYERRQSGSPIVACPSVNDSFTTSNSNGNGKLTNPIGLLTMDEVNMAGAAGSSNSSYYLYTNQDYWLGSPYSFSYNYAYEFRVYSAGGLLYYSVNGAHGARPAVSLKPGATLSGAGTSENPFTVSLS